MSMYKNIFVNEEYDGTAEGAKVLGVNGEVLIFGQSAFASLDEATKDADIANSVIRVTTGAYDEFYVADANGNVSVADQVVVVEFNGGDDLTYDNGEYSRTVTMEAATYTKEERAQIIDALNDNNAASGTVYTTDAKGGNYSTIYVGSTSDFADLGDINGISETIDYGNQIKNDEAFVIVDKNTSINDVIGSIEHEAGHLKGESHPVTDGTIKDFLQEETDIRYLNGTTVTEAVDTEHRVMVGSLAKDSTTDVVGTMEKSEVTISADVNTAALWVGARYEDEIVDGKTATLNVTGAGTVVTAGDSELVENDKKIKNEGFIVRSSGIVNVTDGAEINVKWDAQTIIQGAVNVDGEGSKLTYEGSNPLKIYKDNAILTIKNGGELDFDGYEFQVGQSDGRQGKLVIESGATASIDADTTRTGFINHQNGLISVDGATLITNKLTNNGTVNVSGESTLNIQSLVKVNDKGDTEIGALNVVGATTLTDSVVNGKVSVGYDAENAADTTLSLAGTSYINHLYVGKEGRENEYKLSVSGSNSVVTLDNLYNRTGSVMEVSDGATVSIGYWQSKGSVLIDNATVNHTGVNMYVYNNDSVDAAEIKLTNGATLTSDANYAIYLGNSEGGPAKGSAKITLESGSTLSTKNLTLHANGTVEEVAGAVASTSVSVKDSTLIVTNKLTNNGTINVSGTSNLNVANKVTGSGMIYMDGVTLGSDTKLDGANVRFASGINTIDGATIDNGKFQIGQGQFGNTDNRIDMENGVTVNVKNNAHIGAKDGDYNGWVGTGFFDSDAEKLEAMTDAKYMLNIDKSTAEFGYLHISNDGVMNVTGVADQKLTYNNSDYSFYTGRLIINGEAKFDGADVLADRTIVSCDNGTENGGHLIITNGSYYEAESHDGANDYNLNLDVRKTGVVDVNGGSTLYVGGKASIAENAAVNVNGANVNITGTVTNKGTFTIAGESTVNIATLSGNALQVLDGATLTDSKIGGTVYIMKKATFAGTNTVSTLNLCGQSEAVLDIAGGAVVTVTNDICLRDGSTLNLAAGSSVSAKALSIGGSTLNVNGGSFSAYVENDHPELTAQINISNGGSVTLTNAYKDLSISLDGTSTLTLTGPLYNNFDFDVTGLSGQEGVFKKLVDVKMDSVTVDFSTALSDNENLVVLGNDLYYATVDTNILYVNSAYTQPAGTQLDGGKIIGFNAFSNITDAIKAAEKNGGATIDLGNESRPDAFGNVSSSNPVLRANGTYTFTGGNYADLAAWIQTPKPGEADDVAINIVFNKANVVAGKFRLDNGTTLTITDSHIDARSYIGDGRAWNTYYGDSKIVINNSVVGYNATWAGNSAGNSEAITAGDKETDYSGIQTGMVFGGSGVMTVENSTIFAFTEGTNGYGSFGVMDKGLMEFKNSAVYAHGFTVGRASTGGTTVGRDNEVATMILDNSVLRNTNGDSTGNIFIGNADYAGKLVLKNGAKLYQGQATMNIAQNGEVEIDGSALTVKTIANAGVITIDAVSTIKANTITGTGTITIDASEVTGDYVKVIDLNGTASIEDMVKVSGLKEGYSVVYGSDGDVILTSASANTLYVNSAYTQPAGTQLDDGKIIGYNAFSNMQDVVDKFSSYATENQQDLIINIDGESATSNTDRIFFYTGADVTLTGTAGSVLDATSGDRFYFIDTTVPTGSDPSMHDASDIATVTLDAGLTLKTQRLQLGQHLDHGDVKEGLATRDNGVINMIANGNVNCSNYTIASGSTLTINETGTFIAREGGDDHLRAGSSLVVNGGGKYSADNLQFQSNWVNNRGGDMTFNDTFIDVGTVKLKPDEDNAVITGDTVATFNLNNSTAEVYAFEISADSSLNVKNSNLTVETSITGEGKVIANGDVTLNADNISAQVLVGGTYENGSRVYNENRSTLNLGSATAGKAMNIKQEEFRVNNADITLNADVNVALGGGHSYNFLYLRQSTLDLNGHTLDMSKGKFLLTGLDITGQGTINLSGGNDAFCVQTYASTIGKDVTFISEVPANIYEDLTVYGDMTVNGHSGQGPAIVGVHYVDRVDGKMDGKITGTYTNGAVLTISGEGATYTQTGNTNMHIYGAASDELNAEIAAALGEEYRIGASSFVIENKAVADLTQAGTLTNDGSLIVSDATLKAGNIVNNANFYANAGSTVTVTGNFTSTTDLTFNGNVTIGGTLTVDNLTLSAGSNVTVGNLVVNKELNFVLGAALTITTAKLGNFNLTVNGTLSASEYELVSGWEVEYDKTITFNGVTYTLDEATGIYRNENDTNITFKINDNGVLVLNDSAAQAAAGSVLIDPSLTTGSGASVVIDGIRYTEGTNAFKSVDAIPADKLITGVVLTNADVDAKLNTNALKDVQTVTVQGTGNTIDDTVSGDTGYTLNVGAGSKLTGTGLFDVDGDMTINNDGHLDTNAKASGAMKIVNTSANTLKGTYTATDLIIDNQVSGAIEGATLNGTVSTAISGGTGTGVTVNTPHLSLTDTKFEIKDGSILSTHTDSGSGAESETGILLKGDTDLTISKAGEISATIREAADNVGNTTLTTVDTQTYTGDIEVDKIIIGNEVKTTITGTADFSDLDLNGELTVDMTAGTEYTEAGRVNGKGTLNLTHENAWIVNDTVNRDFSGFTGTVNMTGADTKQIVLGLGDAPVAASASSYFADGTTVNVAAGQEIYLAGTGVDTAIKFAKDGTINVGKLDPSLTIQDGITAKLAESSVDFTQTLSGDNSGFTGTVNVSEDTELTIANKLGATAINMDVIASTTGDTDDTKLNLKYDGLALAAKIAGDTNDQINVQESATLTADEALNAFSGTVNVTDDKTLNLTGVNTTAAIFNGSDTTTLDLDANTTLTADTALNGFSGTVDMTQATEEATSLTLNGENTTAAKFVGATVDTINANANTTLEAEGAINGFNGTVNVADDKAVTLTGANTTDAKFVGGETADLNLDANTILNAEGAINGFSGKVDMTQETEAATALTLNGVNSTAATFVGSTSDAINANADTTLTAAGALNDYAGTINVANEKTVNLTGVNTTAAIFNGSTSTTLDLDADTTLTADKALDGFSGTVDMTQETEEATTLTVSGANTTAAIFKGADADVVNVGKDGNTNTFTAAGAVNAFSGTINVTEGATLTLNGGNTTDAAINLGIEEVSNVTTLNLANTNVLNGAITGDTDDVINVVDSTTTLTADNTGFVGTINLNAANSTLVLKGDLSQDEQGMIVFNDKKASLVFEADQQDEVITFGGKLENLVIDSVNNIVSVNSDAELTAEGALDQFKGKFNIADGTTLTLKGDNTTGSAFRGVGDIVLADTADLTIEGANKLSRPGDSTAFTGTIYVNGNNLTFNGTQIFKGYLDGNTSANFNVKAWSSVDAEGALNNFHGSINLNNSELDVTAENTTDATLTGGENAYLRASADNTFSGNVSDYAGVYHVTSTHTLTLSGTFSNTIRANGGTLTLSGNAANTSQTTTVTVAEKTLELNTLNIDDNNVTLAKGDFTNISGEAGSELHFSEEAGKAFNDVLGNVSVGTVYTTDTPTLDITVAGAFTADVDMTINTSGATNAASDLTLNGDEADIAIGAIKLHNGKNIAISAARDQNYYYLITGSGDAVSSDVQSIKIDGEEVKVGQSLLHSDGNRYFLNIIEDTSVEHLVLVSKVGYSNYVTVNGAWTGKPDGAEVTDAAGIVRNINYDAAASMDDAIDSIRGNNNWNKTTKEGGEAKGAAQIELDVNGEYAITKGKYLMDAANGVTDLTINGREGANAVVITSDIYGSDGNRLYKDTDADTGLDTVTSLTLKNVTTYGNIYGGGKLTIDNSSNASAWTSGSVVVAGINGGTTNHDTELVLKGGYFTSTYLSGGSWALADNVTAADSKIVINGGVTAIGTIIGGGYATNGKTLTQGDATVEINATGKISLGGNIYAGGGIATGGKLTVSNRTVILSGNAENLAFTGTVYGSAYGKTKTDITYNGSATIAFKDWTGTFNGSLADFDTLLISGDTSLEFARRQNKTASTGITFDVGGRTNTTAAMYTVRDANRWEFSKVITVNTTNAATGDYILVSNWNGGYNGFTFTIDGANCTLGVYAGNSKLDVVDGNLVLSVLKTANVNADGTITIDSTEPTLITGTVTDAAATNNSAAVNVIAADAVVSNAGTINGATTQGSVAIRIGAEGASVTEAAVENSGTIEALDKEKYNRAVYSYAKELTVENTGTINGEIYQNVAGATLLEVNNSGTITAMTSTMGSDTVVSTSNGQIVLSGANGTYELKRNTVTDNFGGDVISGQNGILVSADNTTIKAGTDVSVGTATVKGLYNDSYGHIKIDGDNNKIEIINAESAYGIYEFSSTEQDSNVHITGDNNAISVKSSSSAIGICNRFGDVIITGSGTKISVESSNTYAYGIHTENYNLAEGDIIIGEFNADGSVAKASDIQLTVTGKTSTNSTPVMSLIAVYAKKGTAKVALAEDGLISCAGFDAISAGQVQLTNAGTIIGNVKATGSSTDDFVAMDVDAVLNGAMTGVDEFTLSGITGLATDVAGAKAIIGSVDDVLNSAMIDGASVDIDGVAKQIATNVWASLTKVDNSLVVAWGRDDQEVGAALTAFENAWKNDKLAIGESLVADASGLADNDYSDCFQLDDKKSKGTLA